LSRPYVRLQPAVWRRLTKSRLSVARSNGRTHKPEPLTETEEGVPSVAFRVTKRTLERHSGACSQTCSQTRSNHRGWYERVSPFLFVQIWRNGNSANPSCLPLLPCRNLGCIGRQAEVERLKDGPKIGCAVQLRRRRAEESGSNHTGPSVSGEGSPRRDTGSWASPLRYHRLWWCGSGVG